MTSSFPSRTVWRKYTAPDGKRYAVARGRDPIPFVPDVPPDPTAITDRVSLIRVRAMGIPAGPTRADLEALYGTYDPASDPTAYVGVTPGTVLIRHPVSGDGDFLATSNGQVIENLEVFGNVHLQGFSNCIVRNCKIWGTAVRSTNGHVRANNDNFRNAIVEDCLIIGRGNLFLTSFRGDNILFQRNEVTLLGDGGGIVGAVGNVKIYGNWIHNCWYEEWVTGTAGYPIQSGAPLSYIHADGIQFQRGKDITIRGNHIGGPKTTGWDQNTGHMAEIQANDDYHTSAILMKQEFDSTLANKIERVLIEKNWFEGGMVTLNLTSGNGNDMASVTIRDNIFPKQTFTVGTPQKYITKPPAYVGVISNNRHPDGTLVAIQAG